MKNAQNNLSRKYWYLMRRYCRLLNTIEYSDLPYLNDDWANFVYHNFDDCIDSLRKFYGYCFENIAIASRIREKLQNNPSGKFNLLSNALGTLIVKWPMVF